VFNVALGTVNSTPPGGSTGPVTPPGGGGGTSAVPLPAASGQAIAGFAMIGLFAFGKKLAKRNSAAI
jgi:hypothetical protein